MTNNVKLDQRIQSYLSTLRLGIDIGKKAGGIALVRGNDILHAETYVDFHTSDLEARRKFRRGRRTRHSKEMRISRLRSWVLRHKLPDKTRLPDPYAILKNPEFWVQPGIYQKKGRNPNSIDSWIQIAQDPRLTNPDIFIRALTLLFKKRGFKYDDKGFQDISDAEIKDFLENSRIPAEAGILIQEIEDEIQRREDEPELPCRGKKKVNAKELRELLNIATQRKKTPRIAESRQIKESELSSIVEAFCCKYQIPEKEQWKKELNGLLNKFIRIPKFENRLRSGCSWCGKPTPRKDKQRELAYLAAIHNLRVWESREERPLTQEELQPLLDWWTQRQSPTKKEKKRNVGEKTVSNYLASIHVQKRMSKQIFDLLSNTQPKGRTNLCVSCMKAASEGKTMKDLGIEWQTIASRNASNPSRENHDRRVLHRIESILFNKGKIGKDAWRYGPVSFINIEFPEPDTEQAPKGKQTERHVTTFRERLWNESNRQCIYTGEPIVSFESRYMRIDHIYPDSHGGPDLWENFICASLNANEEKGERTPYQWLATNPERWKQFEERVKNNSNLSERKRMLLLTKETKYYPDDPTPLAQAGARPNQFIIDIQNLFKRYQVSIPSLGYTTKGITIQKIQGKTTTILRKSWKFKADGESPNFPDKERWDTFHHAQDAVLLTGCPPHTWRAGIFCNSSYEIIKNKPIIHNGLAVPELAPDWHKFIHGRQYPIVRILGKYPISWKVSFADSKFVQSPVKTDENKYQQYKMLNVLKVSESANIIDLNIRQRFEALAKRLSIAINQTIPNESLTKEFGDRRRVKVIVQKGGTPVIIAPSDGSPRKTQIKPASENVVVWCAIKGKAKKKLSYGLSIERPKPMREFYIELNPSENRLIRVQQYEPPIPTNTLKSRKLTRHQMIWLPEDGNHEAGYYRVKEFSENEIKLLPENALTTEMAKVAGLDPKSPDAIKYAERKLGKTDLYLLFKKK